MSLHEEIAECKEHGQYKVTVLSIGGREFRSDGCPLCDRDERDHPILVPEVTEREIIRELNGRMGIEPEFYGATFENFETPTPQLKAAKKAVQSLISGEKKKILMIGLNGTGKTHLGCAALHAVGAGRIITAYEMSIDIRSTYTPKSGESELSRMEYYASLPLLVIDEVGRAAGDSIERWFSHIIDKRHTRGLPLILISNNHDKKTCRAGGCPDCIENYLTEDVMSRLGEGGVLLRFNGENWRKKKNGGMGA